MADIAALVGAQVATGSGTAYAGAVTIGTTFAAFAPLALPVPAGFTRAQVVGFATLRAAAAAQHSVRVRIAGVDSQQFVSDNGETPVTAVFAREVTGLSGGTVAVSTMAAGVGSSFTGNVWTTASAVFLR